MIDLTPEKARIFRITHINNLSWALSNGLHCRSSGISDPLFTEIGNSDIISKRKICSVPISPFGTLDDYIPFYFTPYSPMLYNIKTGYGGLPQFPMEEIVILVASLPTLSTHGLKWIFTDRHALLHIAEFFGDIQDLHRVDWQGLKSRNFRRDMEDPGRIDRYQAEALVFRHIPIMALDGIVCYGADQEKKLKLLLESNGTALTVVARPDWFL